MRAHFGYVDFNYENEQRNMNSGVQVYYISMHACFSTFNVGLLMDYADAGATHRATSSSHRLCIDGISTEQSGDD